MGASTFLNFGFGKTVQEAFENAKDRARDSNGHHEGYSGDVQTTSEFVDMTNRISMAYLLSDIENAISKMNSYDPAGAVVLSGKLNAEWRERHGLVGKRGRAVLFFGWGRT